MSPPPPSPGIAMGNTAWDAPRDHERRANSFCRYPQLYIGFAIAMPIIGFGMVGYAMSHSRSPSWIFYLLYSVHTVCVFRHCLGGLLKMKGSVLLSEYRWLF